MEVEEKGEDNEAQALEEGLQAGTEGRVIKLTELSFIPCGIKVCCYSHLILRISQHGYRRQKKI